MPLVVPGLMSKDGSKDKTADWQNQLMGKKLGDTSDNMVRPPSLPSPLPSTRPPSGAASPSPDPKDPHMHFPLLRSHPGFRSLEAVELTWPATHQTFAKSDLPKETRVVKEGGVMTMDYKPDRYLSRTPRPRKQLAREQMAQC
jgi:hypothetical protein